MKYPLGLQLPVARFFFTHLFTMTIKGFLCILAKSQIICQILSMDTGLKVQGLLL